MTQISDFHNDIVRMVDALTLTVFDLGESLDVSEEVAAIALEFVAARIIGSFFRSEYVARPLPDNVVRGHLEDFTLTHLKCLSAEFPELLSAELKREIASRDRRLKRMKKILPGIDPSGDA